MKSKRLMYFEQEKVKDKYNFTELVWVFDLDGTLFESHHQIIEVVNSIRVAMSQEPLSFEAAFQKIGLPASSFFADLEFSEKQINEAVSIFRARLALVLNSGTPLYPGASRLIEKLSSYGFEIGIATMKPDNLAERMVSISTIKNLIRHVQGSTGLAPKPDPEVLTKIRQKFGGRPLIMIGDRLEDINCAKNANSISIGIGQTVVSKLDLLNHGAFAAFETLEELHEKLDQLLDALSLEFERSQYLGFKAL